MSPDVDGSIRCKDKDMIRESQIGIWKFFITPQKRALWIEIWETCPLVIRFIVDVYQIAPQLLYTCLLSGCWKGIQMALKMRIENILFAQIELAISTGKGNMYTTIVAIFCKVLHSVIHSYVRWSDGPVMPAQQNRFKEHFHIKIMKARLMTDLPTSTETPEHEIKDGAAFTSLEMVATMLQIFFEISSQIMLLLNVCCMKGANTLLVVFLLQAILVQFTPMAFFHLSLLAHINNDGYKRAQSLDRFADGNFREDIISNNLVDWIIAEYRKAFAAVGDVSTEESFHQYYHSESPAVVEFSQDILANFPPIYFALVVAIYPHHLSFASIITLQSSGQTFLSTLRNLVYKCKDIRDGLYLLRGIYAPNRLNVMKDGTSRLTEKGGTGSQGMSLILKDVSFAYPGSRKKSNALKGINLHIKAGQLVVIVGANGSGKSTLIRMLARLYDPSSGELLIEGRPSTEYSIEDLHLATSLLGQETKMYPLSLAENIGLGYPERSSDLEMIKEAASDGGAAEFIEGLENGYETMLETFDCSFHLNLRGDRKHPLWKMSDRLLTKRSEISGGQRQRIIAARTFMRLKSGKVKLLLVDEPTSALDADGELQLFQRLLSAREGKTMVFVTHRFGHLTKFADQIICLKDGTIVESGSHSELMSAAGEYAKLYKIQARAFSEDCGV